jgi:NADH dehydrogenase [ubiquinone] 1 alpha subcomplex assembly factor 7
VGAEQHLRRLVHREGPVSFDRFVEVALYHPDDGFFARGRGAGRGGGDFITSPQVGSLFGALVAHAYDDWWEHLDRPDPFVVVEAGAGDGRLARDVERVAPACAGALRYVLVERSAALRDAQRERLALEPADEALGAFRREVGEDRPVPAENIGPVFTALDDLPATPFEGVVFANELLDNLPFGIACFDGRRWREVLVAVDDADGAFREVLVPARDDDATMLRELTDGCDVPEGARLPIARGVDEWLRRSAGVVRRGFVCLVDYAAGVATMLERGSGWLRTYAQHHPGRAPLADVGHQDITADVVREHLLRVARTVGLTLVDERSQAEALHDLGLDDLVAAGRRAWDEGRARGDVAALAGRSRVDEAAALTDPAGLGAHRVFVFAKGMR